MRTSKSWLAGSLVALLAACASVDTSKPEVELPPMTAATPAGIDRFWTQFNDPQLNALVEEALAANLDLRAAVARIEEARGLLQVSRSALYPTLDAQVAATRARNSAATAFPVPGPAIGNSYSAQLLAAYEVDLFGRVRSGVNASEYALLATRYSAETVRIALAAQVASTYFQLRAFDAELQLSRDTLVTRDENERLLKQRFDAGLATELDYRQAAADRATVAASVPPLQRAVAQAESALAVLAGRSPRQVFTPMIARGLDVNAMTAGPEVPPGLPSDLLARRPDVRQAEANLVAASARIDEARAQYFPSLTLTAGYGGASTELSDLFTAPARVWSITGGLLQPIFNAGRIAGQVDAATARQEQARIAYVQSVQAAFRDAHDALVAHRSARESLQAQEERREQLERALRLANDRYRGGYSTYLDVLDAQRNLLDAERARLVAAAGRQSALVDLYKALGGGWSPEQFAQAN